MAAVMTELTTAPPKNQGVRARSALRFRIGRAVLLVLFALFFAVPLLALIEFSTRSTDLTGPRTLEYWRYIGQDPQILTALRDSVLLALITSVVALVLLLPTMVWVRLRLPKLHRVVEFLCLLPLTIPALVLVVGWAPIYLWIAYFTPAQFDSSPVVLAFAYVILVMPYMYRSLDAGLSSIDVRTLAEAARSLGAGWFTVMARVIMPNMLSAVLNAALLSVALVLGEFTVASLLNYDNLQVVMNNVAQISSGVTVALAAASLMFVFVLLFALSFAGRRRPARATAEEK
ncbi:ABC transporter permease subunit [Kineosporia sp. NBRC 101731]|uniref:ABC transporter permease n=1 Tax=Kineosporia sp. NBRC 101731 TaxID=3032199 RepID=UPI0024A45220|nr:ABC transporter permease subunit [Kineosporia sp. NBRC 101731]GLY31257.1 ABC transporter permease [Kineosporia sp. NBRC 101731]